MGTEVKIMPDVIGDDPAHVAAMIAKADGVAPEAAAKAPEGETPERPAGLPEGFNSIEELALAYAAATKAKDEPATEADAAAKAASDETAAKAVTDAGLDMDALEAKIGSGKGLDEADYTALAKVGIKKEMADNYIAGAIALSEQFTARVYAEVGGQEAFEAISAWAAQGGVPASNVEAFNNALDSGDEASVKLALAGLNALYQAAGNKAPALLTGQRGAATADVYASAQQMMADMRDPRYAKDPAFRAQVAAKLGRSDIL